MGRAWQREGLGNKEQAGTRQRSRAEWGWMGSLVPEHWRAPGNGTDRGRVSEIVVLRWTGGQGLDKEEVGKGGRWICRMFALGEAGFISVVPALVQNV